MTPLRSFLSMLTWIHLRVGILSAVRRTAGPDPVSNRNSRWPSFVWAETITISLEWYTYLYRVLCSYMYWYKTMAVILPWSWQLQSPPVPRCSAPRTGEGCRPWRSQRGTGTRSGVWNSTMYYVFMFKIIFCGDFFLTFSGHVWAWGVQWRIGLGQKPAWRWWPSPGTLSPSCRRGKSTRSRPRGHWSTDRRCTHLQTDNIYYYFAVGFSTSFLQTNFNVYHISHEYRVSRHRSSYM